MRNISKYFLALALGPSLAFAGCMAEDDGPTDEPNILATMTLESGQTMTIAEGPPDESRDPIGSFEEAPGTEGCWVVLDWCVDPDTGGPTCTATGCTVSQAIYHCLSLIDQYC
jgi:hypothetical protein